MPFIPRLLPTMSFENIPATFMCAAKAWFAKYVEPKRPCSSPEKAAKMMVASNECFDITRASSSTDATPDASSSAPGASQVKSRTSVQRESRWPLTR
jgi:hypothetical protein